VWRRKAHAAVGELWESSGEIGVTEEGLYLVEDGSGNSEPLNHQNFSAPVGARCVLADGFTLVQADVGAELLEVSLAVPRVSLREPLCVFEDESYRI
jgi:hypothetical protein